MNTKRVYASFDYLLAIMVIAVAVFGIILLAGTARTNGGGLSREFYSQLILTVTGIVIMLAAAFIDYKFICKFYIPIYVINILLLIAVLVFGYVTKRETYRWMGISSFGILPSEFAKLFMIIFFAALFDKLGSKINKVHIFFMIAALTLVPVGLIFIEPSLSACLVTVFICVIMLFAAKLKYRYFIIGLMIIIPVMLIIYYDVNSDKPILLDKLSDYQQGRIVTFFNPDPDSDEYYQTHQSMKAISLGQLTGKGLYKNNIHVPASSNDFVFAVIGSEFGFVGGVTVIGVMLLIVLKCLLTAYRSEVFLGRLIAVGTAAMIACHVFVNIGVATGMLPNTGITMPFISAGGSSVWISFACIGLVINVGMTKTKLMFEE